jgi:hypothetical protein
MNNKRLLQSRWQILSSWGSATLAFILLNVGCSEHGSRAILDQSAKNSKPAHSESQPVVIPGLRDTANQPDLGSWVDAPIRKQKRSAEAFLAKISHAVAVGWWTPQQRGRRGRSLDPNDRRGVPTWDFDEAFSTEAFRFVRVRYNSVGGYGPFGKWFTDYPDSDLNFSFRLQQLTTMNVHPEPLYLELTDPKIFDYPFMYMIEPGFIWLSDAEVIAMREYFERGGFIMVDDFWGEEEWYNFYIQMKRVFPDREPVELPLEHPIFHLVYDLAQKPQVPSIHNWMRYGVTYERQDAKEVHYRAFFDDDGRIVMMICHNTDLGDGWEREGESREYFETFSEKWAYPMGINIIVYAMTH